jgi:hypothetical protein
MHQTHILEQPIILGIETFVALGRFVTFPNILDMNPPAPVGYHPLPL